jgi:hypothetical protein
MIYITHIRLSPPNSRNHECISDLKWFEPSTRNAGQMTRAQMVGWIEGGGDARVQGPPDVSVIVVDARPKYVRTVANNSYTDNLLNLPPF